MFTVKRASDDHQSLSGLVTFTAKAGQFVATKASTLSGHTTAFASDVEFELCNYTRGYPLRRDVVAPPLGLEQFLEGFNSNIVVADQTGTNVTARSGVQEAEVEGSDWLYFTDDGTKATGTLTLATNVADGDTVTIGANTYTFQSSLTNVANNVAVGANLATSAANLAAAINAGAGSGTAYAALTVAHPTVSATANTTSVILTALASGTAGNAIATTETSSHASFGAATLTGGLADKHTITNALAVGTPLTTKLGKLAVQVSTTTEERVGRLRGYLTAVDDPDTNTIRLLVEFDVQ